jgi:hypothetical protein
MVIHDRLDALIQADAIAEMDEEEEEEEDGMTAEQKGMSKCN